MSEEVRSVLVTGGAGFIGSHTAKLLDQSRFRPICYDNLSAGHRWAVQGRPLIVGDLADKTRLCDAMRHYRVQAVIHFAASAYVGESMVNPRKYFQNNVVNTLNLLDAMEEVGVRRIVFSSSCATYGVPDFVPINETHPQVPANPYGESKLFAERALHWYGEAHAFQWVALRYFNAAGADLERHLGEEHNPETHLIPLAIQTAMGWREHFDVHGVDYATTDGTAIRDFVHVSDLADAHVMALEYLLQGGTSQAFNLGTGQGHSVLEVARTIERFSGRSIAMRLGSRRAGDPPQLVADARLAERVLGWRPTRSELEFVIRTAWHWFRDGRRYVHTEATRPLAEPKVQPDYEAALLPPG